jgi:transcriptional regulator with XRE-family HTH domain
MKHRLPDHEGFVRRLIEAREAAGLSQNATAFPGCSGPYVHLIEKGKRIPSLQVIEGLALQLGVTADWLLTGKEGELVIAARKLVVEIYEGVEPPLELVDRLDQLSMPSWYADWVTWIDSGKKGAKPKSVPARIPKWVRNHEAARARSLRRRQLVH